MDSSLWNVHARSRWADFYRNGVPKEVIVVGDIEDNRLGVPIFSDIFSDPQMNTSPENARLKRSHRDEAYPNGYTLSSSSSGETLEHHHSRSFSDPKMDASPANVQTTRSDLDEVKRYYEYLEHQRQHLDTLKSENEARLVLAIRELYFKILNGQKWPGEPLRLDAQGYPRVSDILERINLCTRHPRRFKGLGLWHGPE